jgi:hypothetical protein
MFVLASIILLAMCCYRNKIMLGDKIMKATASFVMSQTFLLLLPLILLVVTLLFTAYCIALSAAFYSLGEPIPSPRGAYPFQHFHLTKNVKILLGVHILYYLWGLFFIIETCSFIVVGSAVNWYFKV